MTSRTAWTAGLLNSSLNWTTFFGTELNNLGSGSIAASSSGPFTNGTSLDQYIDISFQGQVAGTQAIAAGANMAVWLAYLQPDGTTYGDGTYAAGASGIVLVGYPPILTMGLRTATYTLVNGINTQPIVILPGSFIPIIQNNTGFALAASGNACKFRSYNQNLNS